MRPAGWSACQEAVSGGCLPLAAASCSRRKDPCGATLALRWPSRLWAGVSWAQQLPAATGRGGGGGASGGSCGQQRLAATAAFGRAAVTVPSVLLLVGALLVLATLPAAGALASGGLGGTMLGLRRSARLNPSAASDANVLANLPAATGDDRRWQRIDAGYLQAQQSKYAEAPSQ